MAIQNITANFVGNPTVKPAAKTSGEALQNFSSFLNQAIHEVNKQQVMSSQETQKIAAGSVQDLHKALILKEQASVTMDLTIEVRNKVVEAYQEVMRMSI